MEINYI